MTIRWLQLFLMAADCKSFTRAANAAFISPSAIIQQINQMEKELGFSLFHRSNNGIRLTKGGAYFYGNAKKIVQLYEDGREFGMELQKDTHEVLRIAYEPNQFPNSMLAFCAKYGNLYPSVQLEMVYIPLIGQIQAIQAGKADVCIIAEPADSYIADCGFTPLYEDMYAFCMSPNNPLADKDVITLEDLKNADVLCGRYPYLKQSFEEGLRPYCPHLQSVEEAYNCSISLNTYLSRDLFVIHSRWYDQYVPLLRVIHSNISAGWVGVVHSSQKSPLVSHFIKFMQKEISRAYID